MKTVTILLTKYSDFFGRLLRGINGRGYSHASISIDEKEEIFYSFNFKGFAIEKPKKYIPKKKVPGSLYIRIQIPEKAYEIIKNEIYQFVNERENYTYSKLGVVLCVLRIPHKFKKRYFCSQFVAELLKKSGAVQLQKNESLYLPNHFIQGFSCLYSSKNFMYSTI